ncbi:hypothetical protein C2845_PM08G22730 [Panicum miliaceum]|uniref:Secreted protein n=1 Tax=Panicum miliaceum TaxID=4540 RepID=A0A3L6R3E3_PANMI|nr:hypothetical protein C2845_PM08G22730 [Panicum miliaceum]
MSTMHKDPLLDMLLRILVAAVAVLARGGFTGGKGMGASPPTIQELHWRQRGRRRRRKGKRRRKEKKKRVEMEEGVSLPKSQICLRH